MRKLLSAALLSIAVPAQAWAADEGIFLRGDIGSAHYENTGPFPDPLKLGLGGGFRFNKNLAVDLGLTLFGRSEAAGGGVALNGGVADLDFGEARVENDDVGLGVTDGALAGIIATGSLGRRDERGGEGGYESTTCHAG